MILIYLKLELVQDETGAEATESEIQNSSYEVMNYMIDKATIVYVHLQTKTASSIYYFF